TIKTDVPLAVTPESIHIGQPDNQRLLALFTELEFKSWVAELSEAGAAAPAADPASAADSSSAPSELQQRVNEAVEARYETITGMAGVSGWIARLEAVDLFAVDTEATSLDAMQARIVGLSFAIAPGEAAYVPCGHDYMGAPEQLDLQAALQALKPLLAHPPKQ